LIATNLINLILDIIFVWYLDWQVLGIAYATLIAEYVGCFLALYVVINKFKSTIYQTISKIKNHILDKKALSSYFKLNRDILIRTLCLQSCFIFMTFQGAKLGDNVVAANAILMNFLLFISFGLDGIANAAEVMVGQAKGENNVQKFKQVFKISLFWTAIFAILYCLIFMLFGTNLIRLITNIENVVIFAEQFLPWMMILPFIACWSYLFDGVYIGLMQAKAMRNSMILSTFGCFFPVWWLVESYGNHGLWLAFSVFMLARALTLAWHFKRNIWHNNLRKVG